MMVYLSYMLIAYLLGSIPSAVWIGKRFHGKDVREFGSKNAGATNTFRVLGKKTGVVVLLLDIAKGLLTSMISYPLFSSFFDEPSTLYSLQVIGAVACVMGHVFPLFAGFRGGKGVATSLGLYIGINPLVSLVVLGIFVVVFLLSHYVSLGSLCAAFALPFLSYLVFHQNEQTLILLNCTLTVIVFIAHRKNVVRLLHGVENKMNLKPPKA